MLFSTSTHLEPGVGEAYSRQSVATAAYRDHMRGIGRQQLAHDEIFDEDISNMSRRKLPLNPISSGVIVSGHDASVVDKDIDGGNIAPFRYNPGGFAHLHERLEVQLKCAGLSRGAYLCNVIGRYLYL